MIQELKDYMDTFQNDEYEIEFIDGYIPSVRRLVYDFEYQGHVIYEKSRFPCAVLEVWLFGKRKPLSLERLIETIESDVFLHLVKKYVIKDITIFRDMSTQQIGRDIDEARDIKQGSSTFSVIEFEVLDVDNG